MIAGSPVHTDGHSTQNVALIPEDQTAIRKATDKDIEVVGEAIDFGRNEQRQMLKEVARVFDYFKTQTDNDLNLLCEDFRRGQLSVDSLMDACEAAFNPAHRFLDNENFKGCLRQVYQALLQQVANI